jgi:hypothetical protein
MSYGIQVATLAALFMLLAGTFVAGAYGTPDNGWVDTFNLEDCELSSRGSSDYFFLEPGYQLTLEGEEDGEPLQLVVTVLNDTRTVDGVETRVVEERETEDGQLVEVSRNYFAVCTETGDMYYFGEEVDDYEDGEIVGHGGAWLAGEDGARAGLIVPANPTVGMKYYQEIAPDVAMDRAEILSLNEVVTTPAGIFTNVLKVEETTPLEPGVKENKFHAPGIGLIQDADLKLTKYVVPKPDQEPDTKMLTSQPQSVSVAQEMIEVQVNSSATISNFALDEEEKKITFDVNGEGNTEIKIGSVLDGPYIVTVNEEVLQDVQVTESDDGTSVILIAHQDGSETISVAGTSVVPEFPLSILIIGFAIGISALGARILKSRNFHAPA